MFFQNQNHAAQTGAQSHTATPATSKLQPTIDSLFEKSKKYEATSKEAAVLNRAVAEFICLDQIPIYTVDRSGFKQLVKKLNSKYELPSRNFFMNNEISKLYTETRETIKAELEGSGFYAYTK